jgi:hypothetical protein
MIRAMTVLIILLLAAPSARAQTTAPDSENGRRFSLNPVADGMLRLDTRTGQVSLCSKREAGWTCQVVPDERAVLESEIARLQGENGLLKKEMIAHGVALPAPMKTDRLKTRPDAELRLPSDAELDRVMAFMEKAWRRLLDMVDEIQKERARKG